MTIESLNQFCVGFAKLTELCSQGKKDTEEAYLVISNMRRAWDLMDGKEAHYVERFTVKLADMGYYNAPSPKLEKVDVSDLEFDDTTDVTGSFKHARKNIKTNQQGITYANYNYNEHSVPIHQLPAPVKAEIIKKFAGNIQSTEEGIQDPSKVVHQKRRMTSPKLSDAERDW